MARAGIGTEISDLHPGQQRQDLRERREAEQVAQHDNAAAVVLEQRALDAWLHRIRVRVELLQRDLAERRHPDRAAQQWLDGLRSALADTREGLWPS